uniref:Uncharacterized protein n=1 Tax=Candidatus Kentrum sp. MB TaxID=2138164 RepID=A0A450XBF9_9GAMM|nr:MAG: hypothetical protein BECKMB1821G_GA0114241_10223 [Candidatus Kentron sp. MB]VFK35267.1 MAG: hypothetical protein BECKMB1821I_GA0114274_11086 [Candidatus Kentron sp. MB]VFK77218.1 MAG: hypothetical protein BECKMB1821H_GA0114242_11116 [Candidatus Kentron sp. MB]
MKIIFPILLLFLGLSFLDIVSADQKRLIPIPLEELRKLEKDLLAEREALLKKQKELEMKEHLYQVGFYVTLFTSIGGLFGFLLQFLIQLPNRRLEKRLKELEIIEKKTS